MRSAAKVDNSQRELVPYILAHGATFQSLATVGGGCPDGIVGFMSVTDVCEFKSGPEKKPRAFKDGRRRKGSSTEAAQAAWHAQWKGSPRWVLRTRDDVVAMLNSMSERALLLSDYHQAVAGWVK